MMMISRSCFLLPWCLALAVPMLAGRTAAAEPIAFEHENWSDLRGVLNVLDAFKQACLDQPVTQELPEQIQPEGYQIVETGLHTLGLETPGEPRSVVLSRTGDELEDFAVGEPYIVLDYPTDAKPNGECRVAWKRAWDYPDRLQDVITSTAFVFDSWLSFHLKAVRVSRPGDGYTVENFYSDVSEWAAPCFDSTWCRVNLLFTLGIDEGIYIMIRRGDPPTPPSGGN